jgi:large conductance mechanosensitive channel protein
MTGFKNFVMRGNLVELAVAVVIGTQFSSLVKQFVSSFIDPLLSLVGGTPDLGKLVLHVGDGVGFSDTVDYEAVAVRDDVVVLSWQEHIGSTVVHVLDLGSSRAYTAVTPAKGGFLRLTGRIEIKSET